MILWKKKKNPRFFVSVVQDVLSDQSSNDILNYKIMSPVAWENDFFSIKTPRLQKGLS